VVDEIAGELIGGSDRVEFWHRLLFLGGCGVWGGEDERDRYG
jgi:hypothetical protein